MTVEARSSFAHEVYRQWCSHNELECPPAWGDLSDEDRAEAISLGTYLENGGKDRPVFADRIVDHGMIFAAVWSLKNLIDVPGLREE